MLIINSLKVRRRNYRLFAFLPFYRVISAVRPYTDDVFADNTNYQRIETLNIELYTKNKDFDLEATVEAVLANHNLTYSKEDSYIDGEKMWQIAYEMEVLING